MRSPAVFLLRQAGPCLFLGLSRSMLSPRVFSPHSTSQSTAPLCAQPLFSVLLHHSPVHSRGFHWVESAPCSFVWAQGQSPGPFKASYLCKKSSTVSTNVVETQSHASSLTTVSRMAASLRGSSKQQYTGVKGIAGPSPGPWSWCLIADRAGPFLSA